jgi:UDP-N-acetylglucosamine 2-epimerase
MHDNAVHYGSQLSAESEGRVLMTMHRPSNVDDHERLMAWMDAVGGWAKSNGIRVRFPVHPRTRAVFNAQHAHWEDTLALQGIDVEPPLGYLETLRAIKESPLVLTDSGGVQKEAYSLGRRCVVLRETTEWMDQVRRGQSALASEPEDLRRLADEMMEAGPFSTDELYGNGHSAQSIVDLLERMWVP